jgi:hypothetical protein
MFYYDTYVYLHKELFSKYSPIFTHFLEYYDGKIAQAVRGGGAAPPPNSTISTITYKVVVYAPAERADTLHLFLLYPYMFSVGFYTRHGLIMSLHKPATPGDDEREAAKLGYAGGGSAAPRFVC